VSLNKRTGLCVQYHSVYTEAEYWWKFSWLQLLATLPIRMKEYTAAEQQQNVLRKSN